MPSEFYLNDPGFVGNADDNACCLHACVQMIVKTKPNEPIPTFEEIDKILRRKPGQYSWWYAVYSELVKRGFEVESIGAFDTQRFASEGESYLFEFMGEEGAKLAIAKTTIPHAREDVRNCLADTNVRLLSSIPTLDDIRNYIRDGWYVVPCVNSKILNNQPGHASHFVFVYGFDDDHIIFHDPGLPPVAARKVQWELFDKAWSYPNENNRDIGCFRAPQG